ncbi:MAG: hypothetical protein QNL04_13210 [SAR324 cluster bacterium]|nr:hypothetical protein [SAR324 cluster bacterium]
MSDGFKKMQILHDLSSHDHNKETLHKLELSEEALGLAKELQEKELPGKKLHPKTPEEITKKSEALLEAIKFQREWDASRARGIEPTRGKPIPQVTAKNKPELSAERKERLKQRPRKA